MKITKFEKQVLSFLVISLILSALFAPPILAADPFGPLHTAVNGTGLEKNTSIAAFVGALVQYILGFLGLIFVVLIIYAGFIWTTAQGDTKKVDKAKDMIKQAVIGLVIVFAAYAIATFVLSNLASISETGTPSTGAGV
jgi:uncharacterized membrane protein